MTGGAPTDEQLRHPAPLPHTPDEVAGETPEWHGDGTVQIAYLHGGQVSHSFHMSLLNLIAYDKAVGVDVIEQAPYAVSCSGPNSLPEGRNMAVQHLLDDTQASWLMFIDTDMGFEPDSLERLLVAADPVERPVVGGLCFALKHMGPDGKGGFVVRPAPTLFMFARNPGQGFGFANRFIYPPDAMVQVAGTGAAFLLIHRSVLAGMRANWGDVWFDLTAYGDGTQVSEDLSFCYRLGQMQTPLFVHTGVKTTHHKQFWLSDRDYRMPDHEPMARMIQAANTTPVAECETTTFGQADRSFIDEHGNTRREPRDG